MEKFGKFCVFCVLFAISALINGAAFSCLWGWFVTPKFGLPALSIMEAYGLALTIGMVAIGQSKNDDNADVMEVIVKGFILTLCRAAIILAAGWVAFQFI